MNSDTSDTTADDTERLWKAFRAGFLESAEGWNGEMYAGNVAAYERRLRARFEALHESGKFEEPLEWTDNTATNADGDRDG